MDSPDRNASLTGARRGAAWTRILGLLVALGAIAVIAIGAPPGPTMGRRALYDAGHAPLFGLVALGMLAWLSPEGRTGGPERRRVYVRAFLFAAVLGVATELAQVIGPRDGDPVDLLADLLGAASFLLFAASTEPGVIAWRARPHVPAAAIARVAAIGLFALALVPLAVLGIGYGFRNAAFPHLMDFESYWEGLFVEARNARVSVGYLPEPWSDPNRLVGVLTMPAGRYPSFVLEEPVPDWTDHAELTFRVWSTETVPLPMTVRVDDAEAGRTRAREERFQKKIVVEPGENVFRIPLDDIRDGPVDRQLDLTRVRRVLLYADKPEAPVTLYLDDFRLEGTR